jgi:hypothetical protein
VVRTPLWSRCACSATGFTLILADGLFELCDAILTAGRVPSPPHLSLMSVHRRCWGSLYAALSKGRIDSEALRDLLSSSHSTPAHDG